MRRPETPAERIEAASADTFDNRDKVVTSALKRGDLLADRYRIERELGRGGMGAVYAAWDSLTETTVAVKLVGGSPSEQETARLREEVRASMLLTHRNIARTHTLDEVDGEMFIVMERLEGETLAARIARGPLPRAEALDVIDQLLAALEAAHDAGVVHRDVKPGNIMCCTDGRVVLMDFGIARIGDGGTATHTTSIKGTPAYMAPEVVSGRRADPRADLYAVGLILFEVLTGEPPFKSATVTALMFDQLNTPLDTTGLDPALARVIQRATAKDPEARHVSAGELRRAIQAPPAARKPPPPALVHPPQVVARRSHRGWIVLAAAAALLGVFAIIWLRSGTTETAHRIEPPPPPPPPPNKQTELVTEKAVLFALHQLEARACECRDRACADRVVEELTPMIGELDRSIKDPGARKEADGIGTKIATCLLEYTSFDPDKIDRMGSK